MKTHTNSFKEQIKLIGKEIDSRITFGDTVLGKNDLNAVTPSYQGALLKSIMKQLDIDSNVVIPIGTILTYEFGLRVNGKYEYINYGNYVVYSIEKQEDTNSYKITCYDKMLFAMRDYVKMPITYPITIRDYINSLCTFLGLPFANKNDTFANYDKKIQNELYLDADGNSLGYTFRDVFDELAQVTASEICLNNNSEVEIRYINDAFNINKASGLGNVSFDDAIEEDIKLLVIDGKSTQETRSGKNLYNAIVKQQGGSTNRLNASGLSVLPNTTYTLSTTPSGFEVNNYYKDVDGNNIAESRWVGLPYTFTTPENCYSIGQTIRRSDNSDITPSDFINVQLELGSTATDYEPYGASPSPDYPSEIESVGYTNLFDKDNSIIEGKYINAEGLIGNDVNSFYQEAYIKVKPNTSYIISSDNSIAYRIAEYTKDKTFIKRNATTKVSYTITTTSETEYVRLSCYTSGLDSIQLEEGSTIHSYIPYGKSGIEVKTVGKNLFDKNNANILKAYLSSEKIVSSTSARVIYIPCNPNTTYKIQKVIGNTFSIAYAENTPNIGTAIIGRINTKSSPSLTITTGENAKYLVSQIMDSGDTLTEEEILNSIQIEEGSVATEYEPYKENISVLQLNAPLRSLPNGVKDKAYIKNNKLYVDRYVGSVILNGSETFNTLSNPNRLAITKAYDVVNDKQQYSSHYIWNAWGNADYSIDVRTNGIRINNKDNLTIDEYKTWLSNNNVQVDYELATPVTEELGEISIKTLDGTNNINLLAKIETNFEMEYITGIDTIDEEFLKDINVNFGEKFGAINTIVLTRSGGSDSIYYPETLPDNPVEIKIEDNQIMNFNNRDEFLHDIYEKLNGLEYYLNDFSSTGITYYDLCDRYNVKVGDNIYSCVMFNDEVLVTQGLEENIFTEMPKETKTDYTKADKTDRKINQVSLIVDKQNQIIQSIASKVADISNVITGIGSVTLENAHEGILHKLVITGNISLNYPSSNNNLYGYSLFPNENLTPKANLTPSIGVPFNHGTLYPSTTLYPKSFKLQVDEDVYNLDINYLNYLNSNVYDEFVYEDGNCYIVRRVGIDETGKMYELPSEIFEERKDVLINVLENSKITLLGLDNAILTAEYLLQNQYTDVFATEAYVNSEIKQTADEINIEVAKKVNDDEVVSAINLSPDKIKLKSNRLEIDSTYFKLSEDGRIESTSGKIGGFELQENSLKITHLPEESEFTQDDLLIVRNHVQNGTSLSEEQIIKYDFNGDGKVTAVDLLKLQNIVLVKNQNVNIEINSDDFENFINVESDNFGTSFNVSLSGTTINSLTTNDITIKDKNGNTSLNIFENGTILADMTNSEGGAWTIQNFGSQVFTVNKNGQIECVSLTQTSQEKYKKNFEKLENALDIINDTDIYKYNLKTQNNDDKKHIGFVIGDNYKYSEEITSGENEGVDIYSMVSVCFKAIQEQQEQIKMLKNEINQLKEMIK